MTVEIDLDTNVTIIKYGNGLCQIRYSHWYIHRTEISTIDITREAFDALAKSFHAQKVDALTKAVLEANKVLEEIK